MDGRRAPCRDDMLAPTIVHLEESMPSWYTRNLSSSSYGKVMGSGSVAPPIADVASSLQFQAI